ncbi:MAG TPA: AmmeMemoRadiSam system protein B [Myxococcales bacterium]|nr:AmmeMemoRadiSam system protein B [Myxococcales bacterium]
MEVAAVRPPAVAGSFYPAAAAELASEVARLLAAAAPGPAPKALIAPHAGYAYSGPVAASAFRRVQGAPLRRVVLLGPAHYAWLRGVALPAARSFATPLGEVAIEEAGLPRDRAAHEREHSLEVEVPFLQVALPEGFALTPLLVGDADPAGTARILDALWGGPETLIVVSSDLSHYLAWAAARRADAATAERILALQPVEAEDACGAAPVNGFLAAAARRKLRGELLDLRNSGDTAGDRSRVVGYGAFAFYEARA